MNTNTVTLELSEYNRLRDLDEKLKNAERDGKYLIIKTTYNSYAIICTGDQKSAFDHIESVNKTLIEEADSFKKQLIKNQQEYGFLKLLYNSELSKQPKEKPKSFWQKLLNWQKK